MGTFFQPGGASSLSSPSARWNLWPSRRVSRMPRSGRPSKSRMPRTSVAAKTVSPANSGAVWRPVA